MAKPIIAIVGRPNVGKSTLFNRITGGRVAIVDDLPGVTRDRLYRDASWCEHQFTVVDTGGIEFAGKSDKIIEQVKNQADLAIEEADLILFVVDGRQGITPADEDVAEIIRKTNKPVILVVNKIENFDNPSNVYEFYNLGLGEPIAISAEHGHNIGDLLDRVVEILPDIEEEDLEDIIKIAVVGRPNVGKSSLVNKILGQERVIVSDIPGTTRDAIDSFLKRDGKQYILIDTAGIRRKARINLPTERYSVIRSLRAVDRSDVVLVLINATEGVTEQDKKIAGYVHEQGKSVIIAVNKWDLIEKDHATMNKFDEEIRHELGFMQYAPTIYISALTGQRVGKIFDLVDFVAEQATYRVATSLLNEVIRDALAYTPPPTEKGKRLKIFYVTQSGTKPPSFVLFVNDKKLLHFSYKRYIENQLRQAFGFEGNPLRIIVRERKK
ncbi:MAG: GTPase [Clostridia bacterium]|jgi:GTP-binding protein|nr:GTPase [Clostridia bacterium]